MKRKFTFLAAVLALLFMFSLQPMKVWADNVTILPSDGAPVTNADYTITKTPIEVFVTASTLTNDQIRVFKNQTLTVSSDDATITGIEFTCTANGTAKYGPGCFTAESGYTYEPEGPHGTWSGSSNSVTFTASSNQVRVTQIVVTYTPSGGNQTVATPSISPNGGSFLDSQEVSISCATDDATIYYTMDGSDPTISSTQYTTPFTITATTTIKAFAVKDGYDDSAITSVTFTKATIMTVVEAIAALNENSLIADAYVSGIVSQVDEVNTQFGNATYWISDDGNSNALEVYRGKYLENTNFTETDQIQIGDEVVVYGTLTYYDNTTYEFTSGNYLISLNRPVPAVATPTFSPAGGTYTEPQTVTISCATPEVDIYYTTNGSDPDKESEPYSGPFTVSETATIKAIAYDGNDNASHVATVTYTIQLPAPMLTFNKTVGHNPVEGQIYMIVDLHSGRALTSANGSSSVPAAVEVTISDNQITTDDTDLQWTFEAVEGGYIIRSVADNTKWLYSTNANNGVRVGTNEDNVWTLDITDETNSDYHGFKHNATERYLGVYSNQDWRAYTTIHANIKDTQIALFVNGEVPVVPSITIENNNEIAYNATSGSFNFTVDNPVEGGVTTVSEDVDWISDAAISGNSVTFTTTVNNNGVSRQGVITLTYTYNRATVTKNVTVTQEAGPVVFTTIPALFEAATSTESDILVSFDNWLVSGVSTNGKNVFVTDNDGNGFVIFNNEGGLDQTYSAGNILSGTAISCTLKKYNGFAELLNVDASDLTITAGGAVTEANIAMADLSGVNTGALVHYDNLICSVNNNKYYLSDGTTTMQVYNSLYAFEALENGETYNITGVYQQYNSTKEILPRSEADIVKVQVQHEQYTLTVSNLVHVNTNVFDAANQDEMLLEGEGSVQFYDGTQVLISVDVEEGYLLQTLIVDGTNVISQIDGNGAYTFTMPTHNVTVTATAVEQIVPSDGDYVRITSLDQLTDGSIVVIAARYDDEITNGYYAMPNVTSGKPTGVVFTSEISGNDEILPASIVDEEDDYYWIVNLTENGYTFTNASGQMIGYGTSGTDFSNGNNAHKDWTITRETAEETAMVAEYTGFVIRNNNTVTRAFAFNGEKFGAYSTTANIAGSSYNFFLDFFVQTAGSETVTQSTDLYEGWNLFSSYIAADGEEGAVTLLDMLKESLGENGIKIMAENAITEYEDEEWFGDLDEIGLENEVAYYILVSADCTAELEGMPANPADYEIEIHSDWNQIGFPSAVALEVADALSEFEAEEGDLLQDMLNHMTEFDGEEWFGDLEEFEPGQGYMYYSTSEDTKVLVYQTGTKVRRAIPVAGKLQRKQAVECRTIPEELRVIK